MITIKSVLFCFNTCTNALAKYIHENKNSLFLPNHQYSYFRAYSSCKAKIKFSS